MKLKKKLLKESLLYLIIDKKILGPRNLLNIVRQAKDSGIDIVQFRDKISTRETVVRQVSLLYKLFSATKVISIVNDYLDVAKIVDSDGLHIGQSDVSIKLARRILGPEKIIGVSCHNLEQALIAQEKGADYISMGPVFATSTKPEYNPIGLKLISELKEKIKIPFFIIGGINLDNINNIVSSGCRRVAVCRAILNARNIPLVIRKFSKILH